MAGVGGWGQKRYIFIYVLDESMDSSSSLPTGGTRPWRDDALGLGKLAWAPLLQQLHSFSELRMGALRCSR